MAAKKNPPVPPSADQLSRIPPVFNMPDLERARRRADIVYRRAGAEELKMDVYAPPGLAAGEKRPGVIFVHGGPMPPMALLPKDWGVYIGYGQSAAVSGFVGVTFNHRFFAPDRLADAEADIAALIAHVRENAEALGIDRERLALWAFSGGGPFLAEAVRRPPPYIRALVFFYALLDLRPLAAKAKGAIDEKTAARLSPVLALETTLGDVPPVFIGRAGKDNPGINGAIDQFARSVQHKNVFLTLENHPQGQHGFEIRNNDARTSEIIRKAFDFLKTRL